MNETRIIAAIVLLFSFAFVVIVGTAVRTVPTVRQVDDCATRGGMVRAYPSITGFRWACVPPSTTTKATP